MVIDEIHLLGADRGPILEVIVSRMRWVATGQGTVCDADLDMALL